ncbi:hypothetical protein ACFPME_03760 [Rhodanobacter umsongensis]|uniref:Serine/threonine protein kinase n=1 Tax=Rhodanobacter umsongensis TaxID=633153 RepID=A0ABW0JIN5_9GAMM
MKMELDEMKQAWARMELRQDGMEALLRQDVRDRRMDKARSTMRWSLAWQVAEIACWLAFVVAVASFWVEHRHVTHLLAIGLLLHAYGIAGIWSSVTQLFLLSRIYLFDAPVLVLQRRLAQLRRFRMVSTLALGLPWWFLWWVVPLVVLTWSSGVDWFAGAAGWIGANLAVGAAGTGFSLWLARRLAGRPIKSAWLQRLVDDLSGATLARVARQLDEIGRFEHE